MLSIYPDKRVFNTNLYTRARFRLNWSEMNKFCFLPLLLVAVAASAPAQKSPFAGRWDLTVTPQSGTSYPQWMEITEKDGKLDGRFQPRGGAWKPLVAAKVDSGHLLLTLAEATPRGPATSWDFTGAGDKLSGVEKHGETAGPQIAGVRAPALKRPMPKTWTTPVSIFNGKDLTGWEPIGNVQNNKWVARDGELVNDNPEVEGQRGPGAANIKTTEKWQDFKLHIEVNCPEHGNSGIYLRGRYEIQVGTEGGAEPDSRNGRGVQSLRGGWKSGLEAGAMDHVRHYVCRTERDGRPRRRENPRQRGNPRPHGRRVG